MNATAMNNYRTTANVIRLHGRALRSWVKGVARRQEEVT